MEYKFDSCSCIMHTQYKLNKQCAKQWCTRGRTAPGDTIRGVTPE